MRSCACACVLVHLCLQLLNVRWNTPLGATGAADAGAGVGVGAGAGAGPGRGAGGAGGPSPLIAVQPPTKLNFRQTPETPEPLNKFIFYDANITPVGKKSLFTRGELR